MELTDIQFEIKRVLDDSLAIVRPSASAKQVELRSSVDERISSTHVGDALRLTQILLNLLNNAITVTHHGSVTVSVELLDANDHTESLRFCVRDAGGGIPSERLETLLRLFAQIKGEAKSDPDETGTGLLICKQIVDAMGGLMGAANNPDKGSSFWFSLTLSVRRTQNPDPPDLQTKTPVRLLLVETSEIRRETSCRMLQDLGYAVDVAADGVEAAASARDNDYDLILLELGTDAVAVLGEIRALPAAKCKVPIVGIAENALPGELSAFRFAGMNGHLEKPFSRTELAATIARFAVRKTDAKSPPAAAQAWRPTPADAKETLAELLGPVAIDGYLRQLSQNLQDFVVLVCEFDVHAAAIRDRAHGIVSFAGMLGLKSLSECCAKLHAEISSGRISLGDLEKVRDASCAALAQISGDETRAEPGRGQMKSLA